MTMIRRRKGNYSYIVQAVGNNYGPCWSTWIPPDFSIINIKDAPMPKSICEQGTRTLRKKVYVTLLDKNCQDDEQEKKFRLKSGGRRCGVSASDQRPTSVMRARVHSTNKVFLKGRGSPDPQISS